MKYTAPILAALLFLSAVIFLPNATHATNSKIIDLSDTEKPKAMAILERRQSLFMKRQKLEAQYQSDAHRLDEENSVINIDAGQLCFELKKAHKIEPGITYTLDEVNARLVKQ